MQRTNNGADDSKPQDVQDPGTGASRLATVSLFLGIVALASPLLILPIRTILFGLPYGFEAARMVAAPCILLGPVTSIAGLVLGVLGNVRIARSQSKILARQTAGVGIFASLSAIILIAVWLFAPLTPVVCR